MASRNDRLKGIAAKFAKPDLKIGAAGAAAGLHHGGNPYHDGKGKFTDAAHTNHIGHPEEAHTGSHAEVFLRTEWAGNKNPKKDIKQSEKIAKEFGAKVNYVADKGVSLHVKDAAGFKAALNRARLGYLID